MNKITQQTNAESVFRRAARIRGIQTGLSHIVLMALSIVFLIPFMWMVVISFTKGEMVQAKDRPLYPAVWVTAKVGEQELPVATVSGKDGTKRVAIVEEKPTGARLQELSAMGAAIGAPFVVDPKRFGATGDLKLARATRFHFEVKNYLEFYQRLPFWAFLGNTLKITGLCIIGQLLSASMVAFGFARLRFPGKNALFVMVLATMMLPGQVTMIPSFILFAKLRWIDTLRPLIVPSFFGGGAFFIFLLRQFFLSIPGELEDAARIDGCSTFGIYRNVILPLSKPALATVAVFSFMAHWNDFMGPLIYTQSMENKTLALGLYSFKTLYGTEYHLMMAASLIVLLPVLAVFFSAQKYFVQGIIMSGIKG